VRAAAAGPLPRLPRGRRPAQVEMNKKSLRGTYASKERGRGRQD
jgi:hypothetical protein